MSNVRHDWRLQRNRTWLLTSVIGPYETKREIDAIVLDQSQDPELIKLCIERTVERELEGLLDRSLQGS